jgi:hypothetical protein
MVEFAWKMFPSGIIQNVVRNSPKKVMFPVANKNGEITYLWNNYTMTEFSVEEIYED